MKKKIIVPLIAGGMFFSSLQLIPALANDEQVEKKEEQQVNTAATTEELILSLRSGNRSQPNNKEFEAFLEKHGLSLDTLNLEELQKKLIIAKAKELGIATEGKSIAAIEEELGLALLIPEAKKARISTEGKTAATLEQELKQKTKGVDKDSLRGSKEGRVLQNQNFLNFLSKHQITLEGKDFTEIQQELIRSLTADFGSMSGEFMKRANELGISTEGLSQLEIMQKIGEAEKAKQSLKNK